MALSLGTLFVKLNADPSQLTKGMNEAADKVAKFGAKMNEISGKLGAVGLSLTALGAGALRLASQFDNDVKRATDDLGNAFNSIMVEIGRALIPVVQTLADVFATVANYMKSLSPETKSMVAGFAAIAAGSLTLTAGVGKLVGAFSALAPVVSGALAPIMPVLLPIIGVIAAIVAIVPLLWQAWKSNFGNVQGYTGAVVDWITAKWASFKEYFSGAIEFIGNAWNKLTSFLWKTWASIMKQIASFASKVASVFGQDWSQGLEAFNETIDEVADKGFSGLVDNAVTSAKAIAFAWKEGASDIGKNIKSLIGGAFDGVFAGASQNLKKLEQLTPTKAPGAGAAGPKAMAPTIVMEAMDIEGKVKKPLQEASTGFRDATQIAGEKLISALGDFGGMIQNASQAMAAGGPWAALASVVFDLLAKSQQFRGFMESLSVFIQGISDIFGQLLAPTFQALGVAMMALMPIFKTLGMIFGGPLFEVMKAAGLVALAFTWVIGQIWNGLISAVQWILNGLGDVLNVFFGLGQGLKEQAAAMEAQKVDIGAIEKGMKDLSKMTNEVPKATEPVADLGNAAAETAGTLERLNESLTNVPAGFKTAAARFNAASPDIYQFGGGMGQEINVNLNLDGRQIQKTMIALNARGRYIEYGGMRPPPFWG